MRTSDTIRFDVPALEAARRAALFTVAEFQKRSGISGRTCWKVWTGRPVSLSVAKKVAKGVGRPLRELINSSGVDVTPNPETKSGVVQAVHQVAADLTVNYAERG